MRPRLRQPLVRRPAALLAAVALLAPAAAGCAATDIRYPGRADVRAGDPPVIWIEPTGSTETTPSVLRVPRGTEVTWRNASGEPVFIRFNQQIREICGEPVRFSRNYDGTSYSSSYFPSLTDARLCFAEPGRYDFVVSSAGIGGGRSPVTGESGNGLSPVRYGTVIVD